MDEFIKYIGPVSFALLLIALASAIYAVATVQIGYMIPSMVLGVIALFTVKGDIR